MSCSRSISTINRANGMSRVESEWDSYEASERRRWAAAVLDTPELISMWAEARNDVSLFFLARSPLGTNVLTYGRAFRPQSTTL